MNCLYKIFNYCRLKMQECKTFLKVIFYIQIIVHLCEGKILNNYSSSKRLLSHITVLQFLCFKGSHEKNLPPLITSVFEAEYFVPVAYSYPFSLHCKAENGIIRYMYLLYFYKLNWFLEKNKFKVPKSCWVRYPFFGYYRIK